jgi:hypothetical protein
MACCRQAANRISTAVSCLKHTFPKAIWSSLVVLAGCGHDAPFRSTPNGPDGPFRPPPYAQLTVNPGADRTPAWLPGGTELLYTAQRLDRKDNDRCLAVLPAAGGAITAYACRTTAPDDSTNELFEAAPSSDGRIAYLRTGTHRFPFLPLTPDAQALVVAPVDDPNAAQQTFGVPYTAPSGKIHQGVSHIRWLGPATLVYVADSVTYPRDCSSCPADTLRTGIEIVVLSWSGAIAVRMVLAGTDDATSVEVGASGDTIYYTRAGDGRIYRHMFSSDSTDVIWDFSAAGAATDVAVRGDRLVASVNDDLHFVRLPSGPELVVAELSGLFGFHRAAFSPDGGRVAIEARRRDGAGTSDIWVVDSPLP